MNITPITSLTQINPIQNILNSTQSAGTQQDGTSSMFSDVLGGLLNQVNTTDAAFQGDIVKAAEGEMDNPQQLVIDSTKANVALQLVSNIRTSALSAYNDIIKMTV